MLIAGAGTFFIVNYGFSLSVQLQFLMVFGIGIFAGLFMSYLYQSLEWALFFAIGMQLVALFPEMLVIVLTKQVSLITMVEVALQTGRYSLFLLSSWVIAIPAGFMLQKLIMGNYYRRTLF